MKIFRSLWGKLAQIQREHEDDTRQESMTRVIYLLVSLGLFVMTVVVTVVDTTIGEPSILPILIMLCIDALMAAGWLAIINNHWRLSRYFLPALFLGLAIWFTYQAGLVTTAVLLYAIAILLASMLFGTQALWITTGIGFASYLTASWLNGERDFESFIITGSIVGFSLSGIALLQSYLIHMLSHSLQNSRNAASQLKYSNEQLQKEIADRKEAEAAYKDSAVKTRAIVDTITDGITITDINGTILDLNEATLHLHGYSRREELIGQSALMLIAPHQHSLALENLRHTMSAEQSGLIEYRFITKHGNEFDAELNAVLLKDASEQAVGFVALTRDITTRKKIERERLALIEQLRAKNSELEQFTYTVSHDLKSPLITINGFLGYLEQDALQGNMDAVIRDIARINEATGKMHRLLGELLELSRIGRIVNKIEDIPFSEIVQEALNRVEGRLKSQNIRVVVGKALPVVRGDRIRLVEAIQNLVDNAAKFMGNQVEPLIEIGVRKSNGLSDVFFIKDNGIGIDPAYHEKVFGLFEKLDPHVDGTGIGLALVKRIIEVHGGNIWVESEPGRGAAFCFHLGGL